MLGFRLELSAGCEGEVLDGGCSADGWACLNAVLLGRGVGIVLVAVLVGMFLLTYLLPLGTHFGVI